MDIQYDLMTHRGLSPTLDMPLMMLLYAHSRYLKDRESNK